MSILAIYFVLHPGPFISPMILCLVRLFNVTSIAFLIKGFSASLRKEKSDIISMIFDKLFVSLDDQQNQTLRYEKPRSSYERVISTRGIFYLTFPHALNVTQGQFKARV